MADRRPQSVVITAKTVDDAVQRALHQLGMTRSQVDVTVLSEGRPGIFGIGATEAEVRVSLIGAVEADTSPPPQGDADAPLPRIDDYADYAEVQGRPPDRGDGGRGGRGRDRERGGQARQEDRGRVRDHRDRRDPPPAPRRLAIAPFDLLADPDFEPDEDDPIRFATAVLTDLLHLLGAEADVVAREPETPMDGLNHAIAVLDVIPAGKEGDLDLFIGHQGERLAALQYVLNLIVNRAIEGRHAFTVDVAGYKRTREKTINALAQELAAEVKETGETASLDPMSAAERRIVHLALTEDSDVETESAGEGAARRVQIVYRGD